MPGIRYCDQCGLGKQPANLRHILVEDVGRAFAADEEGGAIEGLGAGHCRQEVGIVAVKGFQVHFPFESAVGIAGEVFEQELQRALLGYAPLEQDFSLLPAVDGLQVEGSQGGENLFVAAGVGFGGYVDHDELVDHVAVFEGKLHGGFATHGMADEVGFVDPVRLHEMAEVLGEQGKVDIVGVGRAAVVALVDDVYREVVGQLAGDGLPVVEGAEEAVQNNDREALAESLVIELEHVISNTFAGCSFM